jgi:hypothetical protein
LEQYLEDYVWTQVMLKGKQKIKVGLMEEGDLTVVLGLGQLSTMNRSGGRWSTIEEKRCCREEAEATGELKVEKVANGEREENFL